MILTARTIVDYVNCKRIERECPNRTQEELVLMYCNRSNGIFLLQIDDDVGLPQRFYQDPPITNLACKRLPILTNTFRTFSKASVFAVTMKSLRRDLSSNPQAANVTSKVFVRSTKSGKVQKIVRELYLREDIPCSSRLCSQCPTIAPADANGNSGCSFPDTTEAYR